MTVDTNRGVPKTNGVVAKTIIYQNGLSQEIPPELRGVELNIHQEAPEDPSLYKERITVFPEETVARKNIRQTYPDHILDLAESMNEEGQISDCLGIYREDGTIEIIAGRHRRLAMVLLNEDRTRRGWAPKALNVQVYKYGLTKERIFSLEVAENLYKPMTPAEEAESIVTLVQMYRDEFDPSVTISKVAAMIGRSREKVRTALKYSNLHPEIAKMTRQNVVTFTDAIEFAKFKDQGEQLRHSIYAINHNLKGKRLSEYVKRSIETDKFDGPMFNKKAWENINKESTKISLRQRFGFIATEYAQYFRNVIHLNNNLPRFQRVYTRGVKDLLLEYILSALRFMDEMREIDPKMYKFLEKEVAKRYGRPPFWKQRKNRR